MFTLNGLLLDAAVTLFALVWVGGFILVRRSRASKLRLRGGFPLPPGPKRLPIIGNALDLPVSHEWLKAPEWREKYGDVVYLEIFGRPLLFVNSYEAAVDLLEKHSATYSTRPVFTMINELQGWDWLMALMPYGEFFRKHRNILHHFLDPPFVTNHLEIQTKSTLKMLNSMLSNPEGFMRHVRTSIGTTILMLAYGHEVKDENDSLIELVEKAVAIFSFSISPGSFFVNFLPILKYIPEWFPGANFQKVANTGRAYSTMMLNEPYRAAKQRVMTGNACHSMTSELIEKNMDKDGNIADEDYIVRSTATVYGSGADTSISTIQAFILAMVMNPDAQRRGQEELDNYIGPDRLPTFEDRDKLPYIEAICWEVMRWANITPLGGPHASSSDDIYNGYFIPKDTTILPIQWLMQLDPAVYSEPEKFKPERHIEREGKPAERHPSKIVFGFGRRLCPGRHLALQSVFLSVSFILTVFTITKAYEPDGKVIEPELKLRPGLIRQIESFECRVNPRSEKSAALVRQALDALDV